MALNTIVKIELADGQVVDATLNFARLRKLSVNHKELYKRYMQITSSQTVNELEIAEIIYTAYVCANIDKDCMDIDEFFELLTPNREELFEIYQDKLQPRVNPKN